MKHKVKTLIAGLLAVASQTGLAMPLTADAPGATMPLVAADDATVMLTMKQAAEGALALRVPKGVEYPVALTPEDGWEIASVSYNGANVSQQLVDGKFTTPKLQADATFYVVYQKIGTAIDAPTAGVTCVAGSQGIRLSGVEPYTTIAVYNMAGQCVRKTTATTGKATLSLPASQVYIVKVMGHTFKVRL